MPRNASTTEGSCQWCAVCPSRVSVSYTSAQGESRTEACERCALLRVLHPLTSNVKIDGEEVSTVEFRVIMGAGTGKWKVCETQYGRRVAVFDNEEAARDYMERLAFDDELAAEAIRNADKLAEEYQSVQERWEDWGEEEDEWEFDEDEDFVFGDDEDDEDEFVF